MDAAVHRSAEAQGRKPVKNTSVEAAELPTAGGDKLAAVAGSCAVSVAEGYERWAPIYDQGPNPLLVREERELLPLLADLRNKQILDLACGTGRWLEKFMAQGAESGVGIDCSLPMLRVAAKKSAIARRLARAACESLPFRREIFDVAICSFALGHIQNFAPMVRELARVMKPGADVLISDLHPEAYTRGWRTGFRDESSAVQIETLPRSEEEIVQAFCSSGFECLRHAPLWLDEPEEPIFVQAGKTDSFAEACRLPAVLLCHFRRLDSR